MTYSRSAGFDGRSNKLRHMVDTGTSYLAVSHIGDIVEFTPSPLSLSTSIHKLHSSSNDTYRVDDFAWSDAKDTLVVGYLGAREGKMLAQPPNQVILYKRELAAVRLPNFPTLRKDARLIHFRNAERLAPGREKGRSATAQVWRRDRSCDTSWLWTSSLRDWWRGQEVSPTLTLLFAEFAHLLVYDRIYIWSRSRATQEYTAEEIRSDHSSMITSLAHMPERNWLVSSGKDKRVRAVLPLYPTKRALTCQKTAQGLRSRALEFDLAGFAA